MTRYGNYIKTAHISKTKDIKLSRKYRHGVAVQKKKKKARERETRKDIKEEIKRRSVFGVAFAHSPAVYQTQ